MLKKIIGRFKQSKIMRRSCLIIVLVLLYFLFIGIVSELMDQNAVEQDIKKWFEESLNYSTYVNIDHTDTALRSDWRSDLYIHELEIASPDPEFILPLLSVDTVRASSGLLSLFGGVKANPVIQLRDGILNIQKNSEDTYNFSGLETRFSGYSRLSFLPHINIGSIDYVLMSNKVFIDTPPYSAEIPLSGDLIVKDNILTFKTLAPKAKFTRNDDGIIRTTNTSINVTDLSVDLHNKDIKKCHIDVENLPCYILNIIHPEMPPLPNGLSFSGNILLQDSEIILAGQLENQRINNLPRYMDIKAKMNHNLLHSLETISIEISNHKQNILTLNSSKTPEGNWNPLKLFISTLDINQLLSNSESFWLNYLVSTFPAINSIASSANISNFDIGEAVMSIIKNKAGITNISLDGMVAGGKLNLLANNVSLTGKRLPETVMATLEIKDTANTLLSFSKNLPTFLDCTPTRGKGELAIIYKRSDNDDAKAHTKVQLKLKDVVIPSLGSGIVVNKLSQLPAILHKLNKLCIIPKTEEKAVTPEIIEPFSEITLNTLIVSYETSNNDEIRLSSIEAESSELGSIQGRLFKVSSKALKFILNLYNIPASTLKKAKLTSESLSAYQEYTQSHPLQIELIDGNNIENEENIFIEDIYRNWLTSPSANQN